MYRVRFTFDEGASIGRVICRVIKHMIQMERTKSVDQYWIFGPGKLSFSSNVMYLKQRYVEKYNAGGRSKGPYFVRTPAFLFKMILRGMIRYKNKHRGIYGKLRVDDVEKTMDFAQTIHVTVKQNILTKKTYVSQLMDLISKKHGR